MLLLPTRFGCADHHDIGAREMEVVSIDMLIFEIAYSIGSWRGREPRGNALSMRLSSDESSRRSPARAFSSECSGRDALGTVKSAGHRSRNRSAIWRGVAACLSAISCSTRPPGVRGPGKFPCPNGL